MLAELLPSEGCEGRICAKPRCRLWWLPGVGCSWASAASPWSHPLFLIVFFVCPSLPQYDLILTNCICSKYVSNKFTFWGTGSQDFNIWILGDTIQTVTHTDPHPPIEKSSVVSLVTPKTLSLSRELKQPRHSIFSRTYWLFSPQKDYWLGLWLRLRFTNERHYYWQRNWRIEVHFYGTNWVTSHVLVNSHQ